MRGKEKTVLRHGTQQRITPAYAGKSHSGATGVTRIKDHPRVCGEKPISAIIKKFVQGSPPRMRGKVREILESCRYSGITPAYAGKRVDKDKR